MCSGCDDQGQCRAGHEGKMQCWSEGEFSTNLPNVSMVFKCQCKSLVHTPD